MWEGVDWDEEKETLQLFKHNTPQFGEFIIPSSMGLCLYNQHQTKLLYLYILY